MRLERSVDIDASVEKVFSHVSSMEAQHEWSPWVAMAPDGTYNFEGEKGAVGSVYSWDTDHPNVGAGSQTIASVTPNERIDSRLAFTKPNQGEADAYVTVAGNDQGGTKTTWGFASEVPFFMRGMMLVFSMEKMMGPVFDQGLGKLKEIAESDAGGDASYSINMQDMDAMTLAGKRQRISMDALHETYSTVLPATAEAVGKAGVEPAGMPASLTFEWNEEEKMVDLFIGMPVPAGTRIDGLEIINLPASRAAVIDYYGPYEGLEKPHMAMNQHLAANNISYRWPVMEIYASDPGQEPDPAKWLTKVIYFMNE
ncbi:MAG: SRPBCC family protein [Bacteroidia bacterium]